MSRQASAKNICNGRQAVVGLIGGHMVDMGRVGKFGGAVLDVSGQRVRVVHASEGLVEGR